LYHRCRALTGQRLSPLPGLRDVFPDAPRYLRNIATACFAALKNLCAVNCDTPSTCKYAENMGKIHRIFLTGAFFISYTGKVID
jgi:hypothetical protein